MIVLMFIMKLSSCMSSSCAPPHPMWCVAVSCYIPPPTWSMGLPSCCCYRQCASGSFSYFGEAVLIHLFFVRFLILFFVVISSSIALETMFRGMLPTLLQLFPKTTCFIPTSCTHTHTHTHRRGLSAHLPHTRPQPSILYIFRNPAAHSFKPHTSTNPSQFLQIPTGLAEPGHSGSDTPTAAHGFSEDMYNHNYTQPSPQPPPGRPSTHETDQKMWR